MNEIIFNVLKENSSLLGLILGLFIITALGPILVYWFKRKIDSLFKPKPIPKKEININHCIETQLSLIYKELECDRVWVSQFHNGGCLYPTGKSIQKFSIFFEKSNPEYESLAHTIKDYPISLFPKILCDLYRDGEILMYKVDFNKNDDLNNSIQMLSPQKDTKSIYLFAIENLSGDFMGMLGVEYIEEPYTLDKEDFSFLKIKLGVIGSLMTKLLEN